MTGWTGWAGAAAAEESPPLGLGIPSDALVHIHARPGPRWPALEKELDAMVAAVQASGLLDATFEAMIDPALAAQDRKAAVAEVAVLRDLVGAVEWRRLLEREIAVGVRFDLPRFEVLALFRVDPADRGRLSSQLERVIEGLAAIGDDLEVVKRERAGVPTMVVRSATDPQAQICLGGRADIIALSTSAGLLRRSLQLLEGTSSGRGLAVEEDYRRDMAPLADPGTDVEVYARPRLYFEQLRAAARALAAEKGPGEEVARQVAERLDRFVGDLDAADWVGIAAALGEEGWSARLRLRLRPEGRESALRRALFGAPPLMDPARLVPAAASGFFAWSGLEMEPLLRTLQTIAGPRVVPGDLPPGASLPAPGIAREILDRHRHLIELLAGRAAASIFPTGAAAALHSGDPLKAKRTLLEGAEGWREALAGSGWALEQVEDPAGLLFALRPPLLENRELLLFGVLGEEVVAGTARSRIDEVLNRLKGTPEGEKEAESSPLIARLAIPAGTRGLRAAFSIEPRPALAALRLLLPSASRPAEAGDDGKKPGESPAATRAAAPLAHLAPLLDALGILGRAEGWLALDGDDLTGRLRLDITPRAAPPARKAEF